MRIRKPKPRQIEPHIRRQADGTLYVTIRRAAPTATGQTHFHKTCKRLGEARAVRDAFLAERDTLTPQPASKRTAKHPFWKCLVQLTNGQQKTRLYRGPDAAKARGVARNKTDVALVLDVKPV